MSAFIFPSGCGCLCHDVEGDCNVEGGCEHCSEIHEESERREKEREKRTQRLLRRRFERMKLGAPLILLAFAAPLAAQEPPDPTWPPPVEEPAEEPEAAEPEPVEPLPGLYLSAWCSLKRGEDDAVATCDQGLAGALASWDPGEAGGLRTSWVLFGGAETVGTGGAVSRRISDRVVLGLGAGVVIPIPDEGGIDLKDARACVGITASFW